MKIINNYEDLAKLLNWLYSEGEEEKEEDDDLIGNKEIEIRVDEIIICENGIKLKGVKGFIY